MSKRFTYFCTWSHVKYCLSMQIHVLLWQLPSSWLRQVKFFSSINSLQRQSTMHEAQWRHTWATTDNIQNLTGWGWRGEHYKKGPTSTRFGHPYPSQSRPFLVYVRHLWMPQRIAFIKGTVMSQIRIHNH